MHGASSVNRSVWLTTAVLGTTLAVGGFHHGLFEALQGSRPTPGLFIDSIGPDQRRWIHGSDPALTVVPNFLVTGLLSMTVSIVVVAWVWTGLRGARGPAVLLALFVVLTLVGGGIGHIPFFFALWGYSTHTRGSPAPHKNGLRARFRRFLGRGWVVWLALASSLLLIALELSVFALPGLPFDPDSLLVIIWWTLFASFVCLNAAYLGAIARDAEGALTA